MSLKQTIKNNSCQIITCSDFFCTHTLKALNELLSSENAFKFVEVRNSDESLDLKSLGVIFSFSLIKVSESFRPSVTSAPYSSVRWLLLGDPTDVFLLCNYFDVFLYD